MHSNTVFTIQISPLSSFNTVLELAHSLECPLRTCAAFLCSCLHYMCTTATRLRWCHYSLKYATILKYFTSCKYCKWHIWHTAPSLVWEAWNPAVVEFKTSTCWLGQYCHMSIVKIRHVSILGFHICTIVKEMDFLYILFFSATTLTFNTLHVCWHLRSPD